MSARVFDRRMCIKFCIDFRKEGSHKPKCLYIMNLISALMALSHHFSKLNYPGAKRDSGSSEWHPWILQAVLVERRCALVKQGFGGAASKFTFRALWLMVVSCSLSKIGISFVLNLPVQQLILILSAPLTPHCSSDLSLLCREFWDTAFWSGLHPHEYRAGIE